VGFEVKCKMLNEHKPTSMLKTYLLHIHLMPRHIHPCILTL